MFQNFSTSSHRVVVARIYANVFDNFGTTYLNGRQMIGDGCHSQKVDIGGRILF